MQNNQAAADAIRSELANVRAAITDIYRKIQVEKDTGVRRRLEHQLNDLRGRENRGSAALSDLAHSFFRTGVN